jgi:hypothetical protein
MCRAPEPRTKRDNTRKRNVPASQKAAENTQIDEELEEIRVSKKAKTQERRATQQKSVVAQKKIQKSFGRKKK